MAFWLSGEHILFALNRRQRRSLAVIIIAVVYRQPHRAFAKLRCLRLRGRFSIVSVACQAINSMTVLP